MMDNPTRPNAAALACVVALLLAPAMVPAMAQAAENGDGWQLSGDLRGGWFGSRTTARDGGRVDSDAFNARLRTALERGLGERWSARARLAGRFSTDQDGSAAYLRGYAPTRTGAAFGDVTLDEAYLAYTAPENGVRWRIGRFQTAFVLPGVASKSLDRDDSPNVDINWTDGIHLDVPLGGGWRGHAIAEHRHRRGSGGVARAPLDFGDDDSRVSALLGIENNQPRGRISHRMLSLTWMPSALAPAGAAERQREDYVTADARIAATWPLRGEGLRLVAGLEAAYAFNTPAAAVMGTGAGGDADPLAWQAAASLYDMAPGHHLGLVHGQVGAGWLVSPDFRPNDRLTELRYQWKFSASTSMEARIRQRREIEHPAGTRARVDRDVYVRLTHRF